MRALAGTALIFLLGAGAACAKAHPGGTAGPRQGSSNYRVLAEAEVVSGAPEPSADTVTAIYPHADNATPSYPAGNLKAGCGEGLVPIRIHVGIDGRVSDIRPIPGRSVAEDACYREFWAAASASVAKWTFVPAYRVRTIPSEAPGGEPTVERTPVGLDLDYEFMFGIVNGKGTVSSK